ncbi:hypothetical protein GN156_05020 [bacterium LRH843]|nr:hypothetical protein [bacterium LRH843]
MTIDEISSMLSKYIKNSNNRKRRTSEVINVVNNLTYQNGTNVSSEIKIAILESVYSKVQDNTISLLIIEKSNNDNYLAMLSSMIQTLKDDTKNKNT